MLITMKSECPPLQEGQSYKLLDEGLDWFLIKAKGKQFYISKSMAVYSHAKPKDHSGDTDDGLNSEILDIIFM